ncbi:MAG: AsmA family protein [Burkholderiaceae bacterium]
MVKKILIVFGVLFAVLVLALAALILFVDVNRFKPQIEEFVQSSYQRTLQIDGDLSLSVFPNIAVALPKMVLSEPESTDTTLSLDSARVSVKLMPLFSGNVQADVISLSGLQADIVRRADGTTNIDDLIGGGAKPEPAETTDQPANEGATEPAALPAIEVGGIELLDANVSFDDQAAKSQWTLANFNLKTGPIKDGQMTPLELTVDATGTSPKVQANIDLQSTLAVNFDAQSVNAETLVLLIKGQFDGSPIEQRVALTDLSASAKQVSAAKLATSTDFKQPDRSLKAELQTPFEMNLVSGAIALAALDGQIDLDDKAVSPEVLTVPFKGKVDANTNAETANVQLALSAKDMNLDAKVDVKGFGNPAIKFDINADRIDVDKFLPPAAEAPASGEEKPAGGSGDSPEAPIDLSALKPLTIDGKLTVGELIASGATVTNLSLTTKARKGVLTLAPMTADLYDGKLKGNASVNAEGNKTSVDLDLGGIQIGPLLTDVADTSLLEGKGDVGVNIKTAGPTVSAMKQALNGNASVRLENGAIKGINLGQKIRDAKQLLKAGKASSEPSNDQVRTDFSALTATFKIVNGVATNDDLSGKTPLLRLGGGGKIDIAASSIDYLAKATVVGTSKGQGGKEAEDLKGVTIPVKLTGPFEQLAWAIDWNVAAKEMLKSRAAAELGVDQAKIDAKKAQLKADAKAKEDELKAQAKAKEDELKDKAKDKLQEGLKKLF